MSIKQLVCILFSFFVVFVACDDKNDKQENPFLKLSKKDREKAMEGALRRSAQAEQDQILAFFNRHALQPIKTSTGVSYCIYKKGEGALTKADQKVLVKYAVFLLNGDTVYTSKNRFEEIVVEKDEKESGLHEVLKLIPKGSQAIVAIPSYRAHGLTGDNQKIPPVTTVFYQIEINE